MTCLYQINNNGVVLWPVMFGATQPTFPVRTHIIISLLFPTLTRSLHLTLGNFAMGRPKKEKDSFATFTSTSTRTKTFEFYSAQTAGRDLKRTEGSYLANDHSTSKRRKLDDTSDLSKAHCDCGVDGEGAVNGSDGLEQVKEGKGSDKDRSQVSFDYASSAINYSNQTNSDNVGPYGRFCRKHRHYCRLRDRLRRPPTPEPIMSLWKGDSYNSVQRMHHSRADVRCMFYRPTFSNPVSLRRKMERALL